MYLLIILFFTISSSYLFSQQVSEWQNYADMKNVKSIVIENGRIWAASDGGSFSYDLTNNSYTKYNKVDGLNGISITAITSDQYGKIWLGSSNGIIDVFDPETNRFHTILDIFNNTQKITKGINGLSAKGDTIFVSTDFGVSLINANNYLFFDTFSKFGELSSNIGVNNVLSSGLLYVSTDAGVAIQKAGTTNLSAPESWNVYRTTNGLPADSIIKIASFNGLIVAATLRGLAYFENSSWQVFIPELANTPINDLVVVGDSLFILSSSQNLFSYNNRNLTQLYSAPTRTLSKLGYSTSTGILIASASGIFRLNDNNFLFPNGPFANKFPDLSVDNDGVLWSASGADISAVGFYSYDGVNWTNYNASTTPEITSNTYFKVFTTSDNKKIFGNWGQGISVFENGEIRNYKDNLGMVGIPTALNFIVISGIAEDSENNIWLLNYGAADRRNLARSSDLENWTSYSIPEINTYVDESFNVVIDEYDTKWFGVQRGKQGLFYFNEGNNPDPSVTSDDYSGYLNVSSGLNENFVTCLAVDIRSDIWVGTSLGVNIISRVNTVLSSNPQLLVSSVFSLRQQSVTDILVDPLNQKWVGTNLGLFVVNSDGTSLLASFTSKNSALLSDNIRSLTIDENSGVIYVGTDNGLTSFKTFSVKPVEGFSGISVYPNPFIIGEGGEQLIIDGLIADTDVKILSITGKLVNEYTTPGGKIASWDGKDINGDYVSTGVYFIVAFDQEGNSVEKGKVAVIRK